jgi:hypothetical protein
MERPITCGLMLRAPPPRSLRRETNPVIDHVHARIPRADGDLLGPIGMAVETRLGDKEREPAAQLARRRVDLVMQGYDALVVARGRGLRRRSGRDIHHRPGAARPPIRRSSHPALAQSMEGGTMLVPSLAACSSGP